MTWKGGFTGVGLTREEFKKYLQATSKPTYPQFFVAHNTAAPYMVPPVAPSKRVQNLGNYYKNKGWSSGPNLIVIQDKVYLGTPLAYPGTNSPGWNGKCIGVEVEGDYRKGVHSPLTGDGLVAWTTASWVFAELLEWYGYPLDNDHIKFHKEDKATTHDCPGDLVKKDWLLYLIAKAKGGEASQPAPAPAKESKQAVSHIVDTPGDTLNFRSAPGGTIKGNIPDKTVVTLLEEKDAWSKVKTPAGYTGWVLSKYLDVHAPVPTPAPAPTPPSTPQEDLQTPGSFRYSDFCESWAKRFEGKMLHAYWDRNDWAIGYGHNNGSNLPPPVKEGDEISEEYAFKILDDDLNVQLHYVNAYVKVPLTQGQVDALVLHIFQQGPGNFRRGKVCSLINKGKMTEAVETIRNWPTTNAGLIRRRNIEAQIFNGLKPTRW